MVTIDDLVSFMSSADPTEARLALGNAAVSMGIAPPFQPNEALLLFDAITEGGGALCIIACFAKARAILDFTHRSLGDDAPESSGTPSSVAPRAGGGAPRSRNARTRS